MLHHRSAKPFCYVQVVLWRGSFFVSSNGVPRQRASSWNGGPLGRNGRGRGSIGRRRRLLQSRQVGLSSAVAFSFFSFQVVSPFMGRPSLGRLPRRKYLPGAAIARPGRFVSRSWLPSCSGTCRAELSERRDRFPESKLCGFGRGSASESWERADILLL